MDDVVFYFICELAAATGPNDTGPIGVAQSRLKNAGHEQLSQDLNKLVIDAATAISRFHPDPGSHGPKSTECDDTFEEITLSRLQVVTKAARILGNDPTLNALAARLSPGVPKPPKPNF